MAKDQLREFFREKKQKAKPLNVDWAARRDAWVKAVRCFYNTITDYLREAEAEVVLTHADKVVTEANIGQYRIPELILGVGDEEVVFSPKGANVAGAMGRIDVQGDRGEATIVWHEKDRWSIVASRTPAVRLVPVTAESLAEMLKGIMRP
jgi:hypothetical protein